MRPLARWIGLLLFCSLGFSAQAAPAPPPEKHPGQVALVDEGPLGHVYRHFPSGLRLYTSERDLPGRSTCYTGCSSKWVPLQAPPEAESIGDWTVVVRETGVRQWAYRNRPVYTLIHDLPGAPAGDGDENGAWRLLPHVP